MKLIFTMLLSVLLAKECNQKTNETTSENAQQLAVNQTQELPLISYTATTRGYYERIWIENDTAYLTFDRDEEVVQSMKLSNQQIDDLKKLVNDFPFENIPDLEAPTDKRFGDAARMANLTITTLTETYESQTFDHDYPPSQLEPLVNKVLSLRDMIEK